MADHWQVSTRDGDVWFCVDGCWHILTQEETRSLAARLQEVAGSQETVTKRERPSNFCDDPNCIECNGKYAEGHMY